MPIIILNSQSIPVNTSPLLAAAERALHIEGVPNAEVSLLLTDDATIHELNRDYRHQDRPTDVLSFAQRDTLAGSPAFPVQPDDTTELLGDVVISVETAARQSTRHAVTLDEELSLLTVHGILHLLGYDDMTDSCAEVMRQKERALGVRK